MTATTQECPDCGARWGGLIPEGHSPACRRVRQCTPAETQARNAELARVRAANADLCRQIATGGAQC